MQPLPRPRFPPPSSFLPLPPRQFVSPASPTSRARCLCPCLYLWPWLCTRLLLPAAPVPVPACVCGRADVLLVTRPPSPSPSLRDGVLVTQVCLQGHTQRASHTCAPPYGRLEAAEEGAPVDRSRPRRLRQEADRPVGGFLRLALLPLLPLGCVVSRMFQGCAGRRARARNRRLKLGECLG